jgi:hypothetical protein
MRKRVILGSAVALAAAVSGCPRGNDIAGVSDTTFVNAMAELHAIEQDATLDSAKKSYARRTALQERGLTPELLERSARALGDDPERAYRIWTAIDSVLQQRSRPDSAAPGNAAVPPPGAPMPIPPNPGIRTPAGAPPIPGPPMPGQPAPRPPATRTP